MQRNVFVSGGTGYIGVEFIRHLVARGHKVKALARPGSGQKLPPGCTVIQGDALVAASFTSAVSADDTFVHMVGVAHPSPYKARQFRSIDLEALRASAKAATTAGVGHFVFISVAHPAPTMHAYIAVRKECEQILARTHMNITILRPWYVLGPGHRWPHALRPFYALAEMIPAWRESALRLGLVTREQMVAALVASVENAPDGTRILGVPEIRATASCGVLSAPLPSLRDASGVLSTAPGSAPIAVSPTSGQTRG